MEQNNGSEKKPLEQIESLEEAERIRLDLLNRIGEITNQLNDQSRKTKCIDTGKEAEYDRWHSNASHAKQQLESRLRALTTHIKTKWKGFGEKHTLSARLQTAVNVAMGDGGMREDDLLLFLANPYLAKHAGMIERARACSFTAPSFQRASMLAFIFQVTKDERDIEALRKLLTSERKPEVQREIRKALILVEMILGNFAKAKKLLQKLSSTEDVVDYSCTLFKVTRNETYLMHARSVLNELDAVERLRSMRAICRASRSVDDLRVMRELFRVVLERDIDDTRKRKSALWYIDTLLECELYDEARQLIRLYASGDAACLLRLVHSTGLEEDLDLLMETDLDEVNKSAFARVITLVASDETEAIRYVIDHACKDMYAQAELWLRLAIETNDDHDTEQALKAFGQISSSKEKPGLVDASRYLLVLLLLKQQKIEEAKEHVTSFSLDRFGCLAALHIHCTEHGRTPPVSNIFEYLQRHDSL